MRIGCSICGVAGGARDAEMCGIETRDTARSAGAATRAAGLFSLSRRSRVAHSFHLTRRVVAHSYVLALAP